MILLPELEQKGLASLFHDVEMPLVPVLVAMEAAGVKAGRAASCGRCRWI